MAAWAEAERSGSFSADYRVCRAADGIYRWFQGRGVPVRDEKGRIIEWLGTATDIDDQVRARELLARGHDELERLVAARTSDLAPSPGIFACRGGGAWPGGGGFTSEPEDGGGWSADWWYRA